MDGKSSSVQFLDQWTWSSSYLTVRTICNSEKAIKMMAGIPSSHHHHSVTIPIPGCQGVSKCGDIHYLISSKLTAHFTAQPQLRAVMRCLSLQIILRGAMILHNLKIFTRA